MLKPGLSYTSEIIVTDVMSAKHLGSGDMEVLATPALLALMENAAMLGVAPYLPNGCTTVGGYISSSHLRPSKIGDCVKATAVVTNVDGKKIDFKIAAHCGDTLLGEGTHVRFVVTRNDFLERLK